MWQDDEDFSAAESQQDPAFCYVNKGYGNRTETSNESQKNRDTENINSNIEGVERKRARTIYVGSHGLSLRILGATRSADSSGRPTDIIYEIEIRHAGYRWKIYREYHQIRELFLNLYVQSTARERKNGDTNHLNPVKVPEDFPSIPPRYALTGSTEQETNTFMNLEDALSILLQDPFRREQPASLYFLEVSKYSFYKPVQDEVKSKEMFVEKLACYLHDVLNVQCDHNNVLCRIFSAWKKRWVVLLHTSYFYLDLDSGEVSCLLLFDQHCSVEAVSNRPLTLLVKHAIQDLVLRFPNKLEQDTWLNLFNQISQTTAADFTQSQPFGSFAPVRHNAPSRWFINGAPYMSAVADALENAKEEIFIGGWWISPEVFLKRPPEDNIHWRLDYVLKRKADEGVKIYILVYKESRIALGINSWYSKKKLMKLSPNIIVKRHPDKNVVLWSHHEKLVVVDQKVAFLGGIDLCYGRWDTHLHPISDITPQMLQKKMSQKDERDSQSHCGGRFFNPKKEPHHRRHILQMALMAPYHHGRAKYFQPRHKRQAKSNYRYRKYRKQMRGSASRAYGKTFHKKTRGDMVEAIGAEENGLKGMDSDMIGCMWPGKDYINEVKVAFNQPDYGKPYEDLLDRSSVPRLPWHDCGLAVVGPVAQDVARHFIQKWNTCKVQKFRFDEQGPFLIPKRYGLTDEIEMDLPWDTESCSIQVVRNTASWSSGLLPDVVELSIQKAYVDLILNAKHFVYMESQFFITEVGAKKTVKNEVGDAIYQRIQRAFRNKENFRFYVVIPLQPAIAGQYGTRSGSAVQAVTHFIYQSISRGGNSLMERLKDNGCDPSNYITFCGLRQFGVIGEKLATEIVYVHSKLMIVDDTKVIIGSANMNDRSMLGSRDSEIAVVVEDRTFEDSVMDGQAYRSGRFAGRLRRRLMQIHLGLAEGMENNLSRDEAEDVVKDAVCEEFFKNRWIKTAVENEQIFLEAFMPVPNDKVFTFHQLKEWEKAKPLCETDPERCRQLLQGIHGYVSKFPLNFLKDSRLKPTIDTAAGLLPLINWT